MRIWRPRRCALGPAILVLVGAGCYESHARMLDAGPRPPPGAYPIAFAPEPAGGTSVGLSGDDVTSGEIPIGFSFRFFDRTHTTIAVSSNGFFGFSADVPNGCCSGGIIPSRDGTDEIVAYAWTDLYPPGGGRVEHETRGVAPDRRFVLSAIDQAWCCEDGVPRVTTQVILREGSDLIEIHTTQQDLGNVYTQGVEDESATRAYFLPGRVSQTYALDEDAVLFVTY